MSEDTLEDFNVEDSKTHIHLKPPCTPLVRGDKNYFPEGVKPKKTPALFALWKSYNLPPGTLSESCPRTSAPLHLDSTSALPQVDNSFHSFHRLRTDRLDDGAKDNTRNTSLPRTAESTNENQLDADFVTSAPFLLQKDISDQQNPALLSKFHQLRDSFMTSSSQAISTSDTAQAVEPMFPDIFSSFNFSDRVDSSKIELKETTPPITIPTSPLPSCSSPENSKSTQLKTDVNEESTFSTDMTEKSNKQDDPSTRVGFQVIVRMRPLDDQEAGVSTSQRLKSIQVKGTEHLILCTRPSLKKENNGNKHHFKLDHVLDDVSTQKETYDVTTQPLVEKTLQGYHSCVITYGSPGTGKSHALFGKASSGKYKGLIIRAADALVASIDKNSSSIKKAEVSMSFIQIYNEKLYDILDPSATDNIKLHDVGDVHSLEGVTEWPIETTEDVTKQLRRNPNRLRDAGRSHTIFTLFYRKEEELEVEDDSSTKNFRTIEGRLDFVDLVGVNRATKHSTHDSTGNNATAKANKSLQVFGNVIWSLTSSSKDRSPPYRESRLTRLLREALGGNCVTRLLVTASPCPNSVHETLSCLMFAKRAMLVKNFPAPYISVEKIVEEKPEETPEDNKVTLLSQNTNCGSQRQPEQIDASPNGVRACSRNASPNSMTDKSIAMIAITSPSSKDKSVPSGTLPPIHMKSNNTTNPSTEEPGKVNNQAFSNNPGNQQSLQQSEVNNSSEAEKAKLTKRSRSSKDGIEPEQSEAKQKKDRSKKTKRKSKNKTPDASTCSTQYWQINSTSQEPANAGNVVPLPQIDTPDQSRHEFSHSDIMGQDLKTRRKSLTRKHSSLMDVVIATNTKEKLLCSRSPTPNNGECLLPDQVDIKEAFTSSLESSNSSESCCARCHEREDKIKRDYDRMILFSKKDRDIKQSRIEELEVMLLKAHSESAPLAELQRLSTENKKQKEQIESYKSQLCMMVSSKEVSNLQELRRKDAIQVEEQKKLIENLKKNLDEQTVGASKMLAKKLEQNNELVAEITRLKTLSAKSNEENKAVIDQLNLLLDQAKADKEKLGSKHQSMIESLSLKLTCATAQVSQLQEAQAELQKEHDNEKVNMNREMSVLTNQITELSKSKRKHEEKNKVTPLKCDSSMNTEDIRSKLNGIACSVQCLRCAAQLAMDDEEANDDPSLRDAELRILLLQDSKNRELLLQLKRERNLLRDVMKIMYCRQWFTEEGNPHVKRTLRRVGIDTRELVVIKKY